MGYNGINDQPYEMGLSKPFEVPHDDRAQHSSSGVADLLQRSSGLEWCEQCSGSTT